MARMLSQRMPPLWRAAILCLVVFSSLSLMGSSCHEKRERKMLQDMSDELHEVVTDFNKVVVWRDYEAAAMMIVPSKRLDFLMDAEKYGPHLLIETYSVVMCQVNKEPPVRDLGLPESTDDLALHEDKPNLELWPRKSRLPTPEENLDAKDMDGSGDTKITEVEKAGDEKTDNEKVEDVKEEKPDKKKAKIYYGTALIRYINRQVLPSMAVDTKLIKQYWINVEGAWYCDFSWQDIVKK